VNARTLTPLLGLLLAACSAHEAVEQPRQVDVTLGIPSYRGFQTLAVGYSGDRGQADRSGTFGEAGIDVEPPEAYKAPAASDLAATRGGALPAAMLVRTGTVSVQVDSLAPAVERVERIAARLGGFVGSSQLRNDAGGPRRADLGVKVPAGRFEELLATVRLLGRLESFSSEVEDAGAEYVDVAARLRNAHRLEARVLAVLATRAGKVADLIAAERELAHVREDIERYEGRIRWLHSQTSFSTLTVVVHEPPAFATRPGDRGVVVEAASQAWRNFLFLVGFLIAASGVIVPLALLATGAWMARRRLGLDGDVTSLRLGGAKADAAGGAR
jgi:hypothetical protein